MNGLNIINSEQKPCEIIFNVEVEKTKLDESREKIFKQIQNEATLDGFRKGKAPLDLIKTKFTATTEHEMLEEIVSETFNTLLEDEKIAPVSEPAVQDLKFAENGDLQMKILIEVAPVFEVKDYKNIPLKEEKSTDVGEQEVEEYIAKLLDKQSSFELDENAAVGENSFVTVDFIGTLDGVAFNGGSANDHLISIKNDKFIDGFIEGLFGMKTGEEKKLDLKFPNDYHAADLAGKDVVFDVKIKKIEKKVLPELNDELVQNFFKQDNVKSFKNEIKNSLTKQKENEKNRAIEYSIINSIIEKNPIEIPKTMVEREMDHLLERTKAFYKNYKIKMPSYDKEAFRQEAENKIKAYYILNAIIEKENLRATEEDFEKKLNEKIEQNKSQEKVLREYYQKDKENRMNDITQEKLFQFLLDNAKKQ